MRPYRTLPVRTRAAIAFALVAAALTATLGGVAAPVFADSPSGCPSSTQPAPGISFGGGQPGGNCPTPSQPSSGGSPSTVFAPPSAFSNSTQPAPQPSSPASGPFSFWSTPSSSQPPAPASNPMPSGTGLTPISFSTTPSSPAPTNPTPLPSPPGHGIGSGLTSGNSVLAPVPLNPNVRPEDYPDPLDCYVYAMARRDVGNPATAIPGPGGNGGAFNLIYQGNDFTASGGQRKPSTGLTNVTDLTTAVASGWAIVFDRGVAVGSLGHADATYGHIAIVEQVSATSIQISQAGAKGVDHTTLSLSDLRVPGVYLFGSSAASLVAIQ